MKLNDENSVPFDRCSRFRDVKRNRRPIRRFYQKNPLVGSGINRKSGATVCRMGVYGRLRLVSWIMTALGPLVYHGVRYCRFYDGEIPAGTVTRGKRHGPFLNSSHPRHMISPRARACTQTSAWLPRVPVSARIPRIASRSSINTRAASARLGALVLVVSARRASSTHRIPGPR